MDNPADSATSLATRNPLMKWVEEIQDVRKLVTSLMEEMEENERHRAVAESAQRQADELREAMRALRGEPERHPAEVDSRQRQFEELREEVACLRAELERYPGLAESGQGEQEELREETARLRTENDRLRTEQTETGETAAKLLGEVKQLVNEGVKRALALALGFLDPLTQLVSLAFSEKQPDTALERVRKQIALVPKSGPHYVLLGDVHAARHRQEANLAEAAYLEAIALEPSLIDSYLRLGKLYTKTGQYDQALIKLSEALKIDPRNVATLMATGVNEEMRGDIPRARDAYEKALAVNPRFAPAANNLAWLYCEYGGDKEKALQLAQTAKDVAPDDPRISDTLGWILYERGVYHRALALLRESATRLPDNPQVQYHLGMAYAQVGDKEKARRALALAVNSTAAYPGKGEARKALVELIVELKPSSSGSATISATSASAPQSADTTADVQREVPDK